MLKEENNTKRKKKKGSKEGMVGGQGERKGRARGEEEEGMVRGKGRARGEEREGEGRGWGREVKCGRKQGKDEERKHE